MANKPVLSDHQNTLESLRWKADTIITNYEGETVWLKPRFNAQGKRIGITDCCLSDAPCPRHRRIGKGPTHDRGSGRRM